MEQEKSYWKKWYLGVFFFLLFQVVAYYCITLYFK